MSIQFSIKSNLKEITDLFKKQPKFFIEELERIVKEVVFADMHKQAVLNAKSKLNRNTKGILSSNIKPFVKVMGKVIVGGLFVDKKRVPYAQIHEEGGIIKKKDKFLTIPFPGIRGKPRDFQNTFFAKSKRGNLILFQNLGKTAKGKQRRTRHVKDTATKKGFTIRPLFSLHEKVKIPARPYLRPAIEKNIPKLIREIKALENIDKKVK